MNLNRWLLKLSCLLSLGVGEGAHAYYAPLQFAPTAPVAGQFAQVRVRVGECDLLQVFNPQDREIAVVGNTVRVTVRGSTAFDQTFCIYPDQTSTLDLVPLAAGTYRVEIYRRELTDLTVVELMRSADLTVGLAPAAGVPARGTISIIALALAVFAFGLFRARRSLDSREDRDLRRSHSC